MADQRSEVVTIDVAEAEKIHKRLSRLLARMQVRIDDAKAEKRKKMNIQFAKAGEVAEAKLAAFVRGFEAEID